MQNTQTNNSVLRELRVLRQAFFIASALIMIGTLLSVVVDPYFLALPLLVSVGLMFSSIAGWCPMIFLLEQMPWNK